MLKFLNRHKIARLEHQEKVSALLNELGSSDPRMASWAFEQLLRLGKSAYPQLARAVLLAEPLVQIKAVKILRANRDPELLRTFLDLYLKSLRPDTQYEILTAIVELGNKSAIPDLIRFYEQEDVLYLKARIVWGFGQLRDTRTTRILIGCLRSPQDLIRLEAVRSLGKLQDRQAVIPLLRLLRSLGRWGNIRERLYILGALGLIGDSRAVDGVADLLVSSPYPEVRQACARTMGTLKADAGIPHLVEALRDPSREVFYEALSSLRLLTGREMIARGRDFTQTQEKTYQLWKEWIRSRRR
jgi:HEAT repeat protein